MPKSARFFGYAGLIPFAFFAGLAHIFPGLLMTVVITQTAYAGMILSFLSGVHWTYGLLENNKAQIAFSMFPTIASLFFFMLGLAGYQIVALTGMAITFVILYEADKYFLSGDKFASTYWPFRRNLTYGVAVLLFVTLIATF